MVICQQNAVERGVARAIPLPAEVLKVSTEAPEPHAIEYAASLILRGRVVGIPTDTFYGLSADPYNLAAIERVFRVKGRAETKALPILVNSIEQAATLARVRRAKGRMLLITSGLAYVAAEAATHKEKPQDNFRRPPVCRE